MKKGELRITQIIIVLLFLAGFWTGMTYFLGGLHNYYGFTYNDSEKNFSQIYTAMNYSDIETDAFSVHEELNDSLAEMTQEESGVSWYSWTDWFGKTFGAAFRSFGVAGSAAGELLNTAGSFFGVGGWVIGLISAAVAITVVSLIIAAVLGRKL